MITFNYFLNEWVVDQRKKIKEIDDLLNTIKKSLILLESCLK